MTMRNVLLITNIPTPYRIPLFNELSRQFDKCNIHLKVIFAALGYPRRKWNIDMAECYFDYEVLPSKVIGSSKRENITFSYTGLYDVVNREHPLAIICNEFSIATMKLWFRSLYKTTNYIIWSGAISGSAHNASILRLLQRKLLVKRSSAFIAYGSAASENLVSLGADPDNIHIAINTVDTEYFARNSSDDTYLIDNQSIRFIYVGHLTYGKRLDLLLLAAKNVYNSGRKFFIDIIGDGPEYDTLQDLAREHGIDSIINFYGFIQNSDIPKYMSRSNCFIFPSQYDIWGLVLVEAMACALPCISSVKAGASRDLIIDGENGFIVDFEDIESVAYKMQYIIDHPKESKAMGRSAKSYIDKNVNLKVSASGFVDAIKNLEHI